MGVLRGPHVRRLIVAAAVATFGSMAAGSGASAGGWALTTLDEVPAPVAGEPTQVGFTIRQHGVTPVDVDDVALVVTSGDGTQTVFPAAGDGTVGHYVATIVVPAGGAYQWSVRQGWFDEQPLGVLTVRANDGAAASADGRGLLAPALGVGAVALAALAAADAVRRRRPAPSVSPL